MSFLVSEEVFCCIPLEQLFKACKDPHKHSITGWQVTLPAFLLLVPELFGKNEICPPQPLQPRCFRKLFFSGEANDHPTPVDFLLRTLMLLLN
ncbi:hypothetical protein AVEN_250856-1 [Araneus ventricosus]|uniref:Uncharacterized protein n=1 Tax=Araneus ventricosus TaxID=182803 RepID=A0A4Y2VQ66_ARAVE|nr:hypothetical protein AVEN_250856-1 [Araneus ventricosus]